MNVVQSIGRRYGVQIGALVVLAVVMVVVTPTFIGQSAIFSSLEGLALVGIAAAGLACTMVAGELDLSVGSMAVFGGVVAIRVGDLGLVPAILIATVAGVAIGLLQGFLIGRLGINSLVFTVGTLILLQGAAWVTAGGKPISLNNFEETDPLLVQIGVFSPSSIIAILVIAVIGLFLAFTKWGREIVAIGGARGEAIAAGVPVKRSLNVAFAISGGSAALAGALTCMKGASASPDGFASLLLTAVSACLIGGISVYGGKGNAINILLGALILAVVAAGTAAASAPTYITNLLTGALLLIVITIESILARVSRRRRLDRVRVRVAEESRA
jgi:ribose/xylose/arabinose/galactoside ABC-type transport system permease subunit